MSFNSDRRFRFLRAPIKRMRRFPASCSRTLDLVERRRIYTYNMLSLRRPNQPNLASGEIEGESNAISTPRGSISPRNSPRRYGHYGGGFYMNDEDYYIEETSDQVLERLGIESGMTGYENLFSPRLAGYNRKRPVIISPKKGGSRMQRRSRIEQNARFVKNIQNSQPASYFFSIKTQTMKRRRKHLDGTEYSDEFIDDNEEEDFDEMRRREEEEERRRREKEEEERRKREEEERRKREEEERRRREEEEEERRKREEEEERRRKEEEERRKRDEEEAERKRKLDELIRRQNEGEDVENRDLWDESDRLRALSDQRKLESDIRRNESDELKFDSDVQVINNGSSHTSQMIQNSQIMDEETSEASLQDF